MSNLTEKGFSMLTETECNDINGGFAITIGCITITGATLAKIGATFVIRQGIKYVWNRTHGI